jgi:hypothetical protein
LLSSGTTLIDQVAATTSYRVLTPTDLNTITRKENHVQLPVYLPGVEAWANKQPGKKGSTAHAPSGVYYPFQKRPQ